MGTNQLETLTNVQQLSLKELSHEKHTITIKLVSVDNFKVTKVNKPRNVPLFLNYEVYNSLSSDEHASMFHPNFAQDRAVP